MKIQTLLVTAVVLACPSLAGAQPPLVEKTVSMGMAQEIVAGAIAECAKATAGLE